MVTSFLHRYRDMFLLMLAFNPECVLHRFTSFADVIKNIFSPSICSIMTTATVIQWSLKKEDSSLLGKSPHF